MAGCLISYMLYHASRLVHNGTHVHDIISFYFSLSLILIGSLTKRGPRNMPGTAMAARLGMIPTQYTRTGG
ncbi:hypothetical protein BDN72DRAFT_540916 [Pluteus cervinus]|uniref:Uncharacterized protein n=1 Tax=Pluteus cervinus TaxID=181527 RepID=A0ACD3A3I2_9AGAR|nr:hypothetical protein BDN72DRAFT_540916 [Pluteus cervinus]